MPRYHRLAHMKDTPVVKVGDWVKRGQLLGYVGSTGNSSGNHAHYDIRSISSAPPSHTEYIYGWAKSRVVARYIDPSPYIKQGMPVDNTFPLSGYRFLQWTGQGFHPGADCNSANDGGKPIYSPVEGRVVFTLGTTRIRNWLGKWLNKNYNMGWGCLAVIEEMPGFDISKV